MIFSGIYLFSDIDGTLFTYDKTMPQKNLDAINYFINNGGNFALATGRSVLSVRSIMDKFPMNAPSIIYNGGCVYDFKTDTYSFMLYLPDECKKHIDEVFEKFPEAGVEVHIDRKLYCVKFSERSHRHIIAENKAFELHDLTKLSGNHWHKILFTGSAETVDRLQEYFFAKPENDDYYFLRSEEGLFEVLPKTASKGQALDRYCQLFDIPKSNIYAIGDYYNDLDLLQHAGYSAAVCEAPDEVKNTADYVTCSCEQGAVADFINHIEMKISNRR